MAARRTTGATGVLLILLAACGQDRSARCLDLPRRDFAGVTIASAKAVTDREDLPGFCRLAGTIDPGIGFEARLPLAGWNGKYYQSGCGGYCGAVLADKPGFSNSINEALKRGYAAITTDNGHKGGAGDASWALGDPEAVAVYAHRGVPLTHAAGTALTRVFYGREPARKYFSGCSNGGRMAAMTAQRYPRLFDGILGGSGVLHLSYSGGVFGSWVVQANTDAAGRRILDYENFAAKIPALEDAVVRQCDAADGIADGIIGLPRRCTVDVAALADCNGRAGQRCFTAAEKAVLEKWYQGPRNSAGEQLFPGMPAGSERFWAAWFLDRGDDIAVGNQLGGRYAKYLGFEGGTPEHYTALDFDFDKDPERLAATARQLDALDPDLGRFRDAGGKYLMWHGWADPLVLPDQSVAYYERVAAQMGGIERIKPFFRLFMIPQHGHCWEMPSDYPEVFDPITILDDWVETGRPPDAIVAEARLPESASVRRALLCPHPASAISLDAKDARSPRCADE